MLLPEAAHAQSDPRPERSGEELYRFACAACHGGDGTGAPQDRVGFADPLPDFTECSFNTPEAAADWFAVAHAGGPVRAFSRRMPAFGAALTAAELERTVRYVRGLCDDDSWPRGDLNFPRALVTEKAFPENEALLTTAVQSGSAREVTNAFIYERRIGARSQWEVQVPLTLQAAEAATGGTVLATLPWPSSTCCFTTSTAARSSAPRERSCCRRAKRAQGLAPAS